MIGPFVTGIGALAPNGVGVEEYWRATLEGRGGIRPLGGDGAAGGADGGAGAGAGDSASAGGGARGRAGYRPVRLAGRIVDFDPAEQLPDRLRPQTDRVTRLALVAAQAALLDADVDDAAALPDYHAGVVSSTAAGGFEFTHRELRKLWTNGPRTVSVYESFAWFYAANTGQIAIRHRMRGPGAALVAEQAGGLDAIGQALRSLRAGAGLMVAGGMESALDPWGWAAYAAGGGLDSECDPARAYRPFDATAAGSVPGEGGAYLVLETPDAARARGARRVYGQLAGYAAGFDPAPWSDRPPALGRVAALALSDAGLAPDDIDAVFADAAGTAVLDEAEARALRELFGARAVPVTAPKALIGRLAGGGAPLDVAAALLAIRDGVIPHTAKTAEVPAEYGLDLVLGAPREARVRAALVLARGRGGFNAAAVVRTPS